MEAMEMGADALMAHAAIASRRQYSADGTRVQEKAIERVVKRICLA